MVFQTTYWLYMLIFYTVEYFVNLPNSIEQQIQHLHLFMAHQQTISSLAAFPGGEAIYKTKPPTKLTFLSGDNHHNNKIRKLHLAVDTESLGKNILRGFQFRWSEI